MVHLPPGCIFTVHPANPSQDSGESEVGGAEQRVGGPIERDETAHCYRDHFLGQVRLNLAETDFTNLAPGKPHQNSEHCHKGGGGGGSEGVPSAI